MNGEHNAINSLIHSSLSEMGPVVCFAIMAHNTYNMANASPFQNTRRKKVCKIIIIMKWHCLQFNQINNALKGN